MRACCAIADASRMALPLRGEVADEWWTDLLLGNHVGVEHVDDEVSHERLALWPLA